jgi:hypothetical protein
MSPIPVLESLPEGQRVFLFVGTCPVECEAYSSGASRQTKELSLCGSASSACPACPVECEAYSSGVGGNHRTGVRDLSLLLGDGKEGNDTGNLLSLFEKERGL